MRNNKGKKIIKPAGSELMDYLNRGYAICNKCGAVMDRRRDPQGGCRACGGPYPYCKASCKMFGN